MKRSAVWLLIVGLTVIISACAPNRLSKSLEPRDSAEAAVVVAPVPNGRSLQPQLGNADINLDEVVTLLPPDGIPAIFPDAVPNIMISAADADAAGMNPNVRVLGVSINGESRAYPLPYMSAHEIVNDEVGGKLIAATW